jgi:flagellar L-ring protein precursor FlgH
MHRTSSRIFRLAAEILPLLVLGAALAGCATTANTVKTPPPAPVAHKVAPSVPPAPYPEAGPRPESMAPTGSLWAPTSGSLFADLKAAKVGDVVTITITEESSGSKAATTSASKDKTFSGQFTFSGAGLGASGVANPKGAMSFGPYSGQFTHGFKGDGSTTKTDSMTASMTATVGAVLPNGNLLVRGSRWTKVNDEMQQLVLEGVVRPVDINRNNTVSSQNVAEAKIFLLGKGPVTQHQKPGWLGQVLDFLSPF